MGASAKIVLFTSKKLNDNRHPVLLRVVIDRKPMYFNIGNNLKCTVEQWDEAKGQFNKSFTNWKEANRNIHTAIGKADKILIDLQIERPNFTHNDFKRLFVEKKKRIFLFEYMDEIIIRLKKAGKIGNALTYQTCRNVLFKFFEKDLELSDITGKNLQIFIEDCQSKGLKPLSINNYNAHP